MVVLILLLLLIIIAAMWGKLPWRGRPTPIPPLQNPLGKSAPPGHGDLSRFRLEARGVNCLITEHVPYGQKPADLGQGAESLTGMAQTRRRICADRLHRAFSGP
jgi:hypothetical protein